jgi:hypothetical protein
MFGRKPVVQEVRNVTVIELSDESRQALVSLDSDIQTLREFMLDVSDKASRIMAALHGEIVAQIPGYSPPAQEVGVQPFAGERVELPGYMHQNEPENVLPDDQRVRSTPFTRAPRHVQVSWLTQVMGDGAWYPAVTIAREYATDERHFRYMRSAVTARLREMHEEGLCERRDSHVKGSMFEYRIVRTGQ